MKKILLTLLAVVSFTTCFAYDACIDGIYYNLVAKAKIAEVTSGDNKYEGSVDIPANVIYEGIEYSVTSIGRSAFLRCSDLTTVTIPNSVTSIDVNAFYGCSNLTSVTIPNSVTSIGDYAFYSCASLASIALPNSLTKIGSSALSANLKSIIISCTDNDDFANYLKRNDINSIFYSDYLSKIPHQISINGKIQNEITIPDSVTSINNYAFYYCSNIASVNIPNSVTSIGDYAFYGCLGLTSITVPNSVTSIGDYAFYCCRYLTSVTLSESLTNIAEYLFACCSRLTSINIPNSVENIGICAFQECSALASVTISNSVKTIDIYAFRDCPKLTSVTIPNSVKKIDARAFDRCYGLESITLPSSITNISNTAFNDCYYLKYVIISYSDNNDFASNISNNFETYSSGNLSSTKHQISINGEIQNVITIPDSVTTIGNYAFYKCSDLKSVTIPNSVTTIGDYAFDGCSNLTSVTIPNSATSIGDYAFYDCSRLTSLTIPNSVTSIGKQTFYGCTCITSITIPNSVVNIGDYAFDDNLTSLTISCKDDEDFANYLERKDIRIFCKNRLALITHHISINDKIQNAVTIPNSVINIGDYAFYKCSDLKSVVIPNSATNIGSYSFYMCNELTSVTIGSSVIRIDSQAFTGCKNIENVYCCAETVPTLGSEIFSDAYIEYATLHVPEGSVELYKSAEQWKEFGTIVGFDVTSIDAISNNRSNNKDCIYSLDGKRQVQLKKGINIINGKKIFISK